MNTKQNTQTKPGNAPVQNMLLANTEKQISETAKRSDEDTGIVHDAKIITPQPYGVYALCKIFEKLQIN